MLTFTVRGVAIAAPADAVEGGAALTVSVGGVAVIADAVACSFTTWAAGRSR
jgi:hypothetical protein